MVNSGTYSTNDLWLSAFLKAKGVKLIRVEGENRKAIFVFEDSEVREGLTKDFYNGGMVGITEIRNAISDLKSAIFNLS